MELENVKLNKETPNFHQKDSQYDRTKFTGRLQYFFAITDFRKAFVSDRKLNETKDIVLRKKKEPTAVIISEKQWWKTKHLYDSAFHPDTGDKMNIFGRMSFQVPGGMAITGALLHFYKTPLQVVVGQWLNQSFNAFVNYTNRNAASTITTKEMGIAYFTATTAALGVALSLNRYAQKAPPIVARWVPFAAVASANAVNIPMSRQSELKDGVVIYDEKHNPVGKSKKAARIGITQVVISRITMAAPGMLLVPVLMERLIKFPKFQQIKWLHLPLQTAAVGAFLVIMVPFGCALFPQCCTMPFDSLEEDVKKSISEQFDHKINFVHFNKGL